MLASRLITEQLTCANMTIFDPDSDSLPSLKELDALEGAPRDAAWFWGEDDEAGPSPLRLTLRC